MSDNLCWAVDLSDPYKGYPICSRLSSPRYGLHSEISTFSGARFDWKETAEEHVFKVDLAGLKKEDVKVELEEVSVLKISGERKREKAEKTDTWHRVERSSGRFSRSFSLPENVKVDGERRAHRHSP